MKPQEITTLKDKLESVNWCILCQHYKTKCTGDDDEKGAWCPQWKELKQ